MRDFPPYGTAQTVKEALGSLSIGKVLPERTESGTVTGLCYVELNSEADARKAPHILKEGVVVSGRKVKVAFLPMGELEVCSRNLERLRGVVGGVGSAGIGGSFTGPSRDNGVISPEQPRHPKLAPPSMETQPFHDGPQNAGIQNGGYDPSSMLGHQPGMSRPTGGGPQRVFISGLPLSAMERDVGDFFSDVGVIPQTIEIAYDDNRVPVGNAFVQFGSAQEAERALDKNGGFMGGHTVTVTLIDRPSSVDQASVLPAGVYASSQMNSEDTGHLGSPYQGHGGGGGGGGPRMGHAGQLGGPGGPHHRPNVMMGGDGGGNGGPRFGGPRFQPNGGRGGFGPRGPPRQPMRMRMPMEFRPGVQNGGPNVSNNGNGMGRDDSPTPGFGAPGCVVALSNVPHKAVCFIFVVQFHVFSFI